MLAVLRDEGVPMGEAVAKVERITKLSWAAFMVDRSPPPPGGGRIAGEISAEAAPALWRSR